MIEHLLEDSQEWYRLREFRREHYDRASDLVRQFDEDDIFTSKLMGHNLAGIGGGTTTAQGARGSTSTETVVTVVQVRGRLLEQVTFLETRCGQALSELDTQTKELIQPVRRSNIEV